MLFKKRMRKRNNTSYSVVMHCTKHCSHPKWISCTFVFLVFWRPLGCGLLYGWHQHIIHWDDTLFCSAVITNVPNDLKGPRTRTKLRNKTIQTTDWAVVGGWGLYSLNTIDLKKSSQQQRLQWGRLKGKVLLFIFKCYQHMLMEQWATEGYNNGDQSGAMLLWERKAGPCRTGRHVAFCV